MPLNASRILQLKRSAHAGSRNCRLSCVPPSERPRAARCAIRGPTIWRRLVIRALLDRYPAAEGGRGGRDSRLRHAGRRGRQQHGAASRRLRAGLPDSVPGMTINRFCSSGLQAIALAADRIRAGGARYRDRRRQRIDEQDAARRAEARAQSLVRGSTGRRST